MWLSETEIEILELFAKNIFLEVSINELSKKLKKHYRVVRVNVLRLIKKEVLKSKDIAGAKLVSLNFNTPSTVPYLSYVEEVSTYSKMTQILPQISDIIKGANRIDNSFVIGIFGSYVEAMKKSISDIDLFVICNEGKLKEFKSLIKTFPSIEEDVHWNTFTFDEFKKGLKEKGVLVYKEIVKSKRILKGAENFYTMLYEAGKIED